MNDRSHLKFDLNQIKFKLRENVWQKLKKACIYKYFQGYFIKTFSD